MALDIMLNFPRAKVSQVHLWTFGAPQVTDDIFYQSAMKAAPKLRKFLRQRYYRFLSLSDVCETDFVAEVTQKALPAHQMNLRGTAARKLGGVHGSVIHFDATDPHYVLTPEQWSNTLREKSPTRNAITAHSMMNYLQGIARESRHFPIETDLPVDMIDWLAQSEEMNDLFGRDF